MTEREQLEQAIAALEAQRSVLGDAVVEAALVSMREKLAQAAAPTPDQQGERKLVTVMFADLSGFTALSEKLDPEHVRSLMNDCFNALVPVVEKYGGVVDKFVGDAIMALFGAPVARENDAERALRAALEMMDALAVFNAHHDTDLGMHIGINTGLVIAGGIGSEGRQQYSVMGDTVNLAARLEDASERGEVLVGPGTHRLTAPLFDFEALPPIQVKGKAEPVVAHRLISLKAVPGPVRGIAGLRSPLVGRDAEMQQLQSALRDLSAGKGGVIAITGEAGLGKSRLVAELRRSPPTDVLWAEGRAQSYTEGMSYWIARSVLDGLMGVRADTPLAEVEAALRAHVEAACAGKIADVYPYLARLRGVTPDAETEERVKHLKPEALQREMWRAFGDYLRARCRSAPAGTQPMVLVWEDLHWADPSSLGLLETLLPMGDELPLLLLLVFRPQEGRVWDWYQQMMTTGDENYQVIDLSPLTHDNSTRLIENLLKIESLSQATRTLILNKAEGNPFFLEELLRSLIDAGLVLLESDGAGRTRVVAVDAIEELHVPDTLQGVIAARIDRLPPGDKRVLQSASVIGRVFQQPVLVYLLERESARAQLDASLGELQRRELIRWRVELEYIFKHAVTQDVAYHGLLMARRKELHHVTAEAIEALFPDQLEELSATLAYHYQRAEVRHKAIHHFTRAADRARQTYSNAEAIAFYRAALEQVDHLRHESKQPDAWRERAAQLYENLGDVLSLIGQSDEARSAYRDALSQVPEHDRIWQSRLYRKEGNTWVVLQRQLEKALQAYDAAEAALSPASAEPAAAWQHEWLEIQLDRIWGCYRLGRASEITKLAEEIRPIVDQHGTATQRARFFRSLVLGAFLRDRYVVSDETLTHADASLAASRESGEIGEITFSTFVAAFCHLWRSELDEAKEGLQAALKLAEQTGDLEQLVLSLTWLTGVYRKQGQVEQVRRYAARSLDAAMAGKMPMYVGMAKGNLAWVAWYEGNLTDAQTNGRAALEIWGQIPMPGKFIALWPLIAVAVDQGQDAEAIEYARELLPSSQARLPEALETVVQDAIKAWEGGDAETTHILLNKAVELAQRTGWF